MTSTRGRTSASAGQIRAKAASFSIDRIDARVVAVGGAFALGLTGPLVEISGAEASTASFYRALFAVPLLIMLRTIIRRVSRPTTTRPPIRRRLVHHGVALLAGVFLGLDMVLWTKSILSIGAGIATVVVNVQVIVVPIVSLILFGERLRRSFWLLTPVLLAGVGIAGGALGSGLGGTEPWFGTLMGVAAGASYSGYLLLLRHASVEPGRRMATLTDAMLAAAGVGAVTGFATGNLDFAPGWSAIGWLLLVAVTGQVLAWLLLGSALARLSASTGSVLLLIQPIFALALSAALLGERPSLLQLGGCAVVLGVVMVLSRQKAPAGRLARGARRPVRTLLGRGSGRKPSG